MNATLEHLNFKVALSVTVTFKGARESHLLYLRLKHVLHMHIATWGDPLTPRPEDHSWPRELWFSIYSIYG